MSNRPNQGDSPKLEYKVWSSHEELLKALGRDPESKQKLEKATNARIDEEIKSNPDKEPFDFGKLSKLYWRQATVGSGLSEKSSEAAIQSYRERYYLDYKNVNSIEEFARELEKLDAYGSS